VVQFLAAVAILTSQTCPDYSAEGCMCKPTPQVGLAFRCLSVDLPECREMAEIDAAECHEHALADADKLDKCQQQLNRTNSILERMPKPDVVEAPAWYEQPSFLVPATVVATLLTLRILDVSGI
jgi:hypothetical protein